MQAKQALCRPYRSSTTNSVHSSADQLSWYANNLQFHASQAPLHSLTPFLFCYPHLNLATALILYSSLSSVSTIVEKFALVHWFLWLLWLHSPHTNKSMCLGLFALAETVTFSLLINRTTVCLEGNWGLCFQQSLCGYWFQIALLYFARWNKIKEQTLQSSNTPLQIHLLWNHPSVCLLPLCFPKSSDKTRTTGPSATGEN